MVRCTPVRCQDQAPPPECSQAGFVTVTRPLDDNPCCLETLCGEPCAQCPGRAGVWQKRVVGHSCPAGGAEGSRNHSWTAKAGRPLGGFRPLQNEAGDLWPARCSPGTVRRPGGARRLSRFGAVVGSMQGLAWSRRAAATRAGPSQLPALSVCNRTTCPHSPPQCRLGEELTHTEEEGGCCPTFHCREWGWAGRGCGGEGLGALCAGARGRVVSKQSLPAAQQHSLLPLLPEPKLCTYNGTSYGVRSLGGQWAGPWAHTCRGTPRAPLHQHSLSQKPSPACALLHRSREAVHLWAP